MSDHLNGEKVEVESQLLLLTTNMERLTTELKEVTTELRRTNDSVTAQQTEARLVREQMNRLSGEVWDRNNASRIQNLELHVKGLYALVGFLVLTVAGRLAPAILHFFVYGK